MFQPHSTPQPNPWTTKHWLSLSINLPPQKQTDPFDATTSSAHTVPTSCYSGKNTGQKYRQLFFAFKLHIPKVTRWCVMLLVSQEISHQMGLWPFRSCCLFHPHIHIYTDTFFPNSNATNVHFSKVCFLLTIHQYCGLSIIGYWLLTL